MLLLLGHEARKACNGLSWHRVSRPRPGTLGWKSVCGAVSSCPALSHRIVPSHSCDFGTS